MSAWRAIRSHPLTEHALLLCLAYAVVLLARAAGTLEPLELVAYDALVRTRAAVLRVPPAPVTLISASEDDLNRWGWPLSDLVLAEVIEKIAAAGPRAVGIDLYRDVPHPPGEDALRAALERHQNVIAVFKFSGGESAIPPPAALRDTDRLGFADMLPDAGGIVRRALLFLDDGQTVAQSLPLRLALEYLKHDRIHLAADPHHRERLRLGSVTLPPLERNDGAYVNADDAGYQILIDYRDGRAPFARASLSEILDASSAPVGLRDGIVILGVGAQSVKDFFFTPFSRGLGDGWTSYGNELHGHVVAQLLRHAQTGLPPTEPLPRPLDAVWILAWCLAGGLVAYNLRSPLALALALTAGTALLLVTCVVAFMAAIWLSFVPAAFAEVGAALLLVAMTSKEERAQRRLLMDMFSRQVSPAIAESLWSQRAVFLDGGRPRPQRLTATVLFSDLKDFTVLSETHDPQELMAWLNEYMETMSNVVLDHGGVLDKFIGDAIMAVFGVPIARSRPDEIAADARAALDCALAMRAALARLNDDWAREGRPCARMRVGVCTGPVVAGSIGSVRRMNYTVVGDTVNTAARLENFDKTVGMDQPCRIVVAASTLALVGGAYPVRPVGEVALKGKTQKVAVFLLVDSHERALPVREKEARHA